MLLIIFSIIAAAAFLVLFKVSHERKIDILVYLVIGMVAANYLNEIYNSFRYIDRFSDISHPSSIQFANPLYKIQPEKYNILS